MGGFSEVAAGLRPYPEGEPGWKEPTTSRDAAKAVASDAANLRELVYTAIAFSGNRGATPDEIAALLKRTVLAVRPRVSELARSTPPRIVVTGERRTNDSGLKAKVWRAA